METGIVFVIGLVMGIMVRKMMTGDKSSYTNGGYSPRANIVQAGQTPSPIPTKCGSLSMMTAAERADGYIRLAKITTTLMQKDMFIEKAEAILNSGIYTNGLQQGCRAEVIPQEMVK